VKPGRIHVGYQFWQRLSLDRILHDCGYDEPRLSAEFEADKHLHAERLDGCYLLKTSREDLSGDELWRIYILLIRAENAFRDMKSPLAERPIWDFHREDLARQGRAHVVGDSARYSQDPSDLHRRAAY
jgi:hypothetical protein